MNGCRHPIRANRDVWSLPFRLCRRDWTPPGPCGPAFKRPKPIDALTSSPDRTELLVSRNSAGTPRIWAFGRRSRISPPRRIVLNPTPSPRPGDWLPGSGKYWTADAPLATQQWPANRVIPLSRQSDRVAASDSRRSYFFDARKITPTKAGLAVSPL